MKKLLLVFAWYSTIMGLAFACTLAAHKPPKEPSALEVCASNLANVQLVKDQAAKMNTDPAALAKRICDTALLAVTAIEANVAKDVGAAGAPQ